MSADLPQAYIAFSLEPRRFTPGRIRFRVPEKRGDQEYFERAALGVRQIGGVLEVACNPGTASLLILHDLIQEELLSNIRDLGLFRIGPRDRLRREEMGLPQLTEKERAVLEFLLFAGLSIYQFMNGHALSAGSALATSAQEFWSRIPRGEG